MPLTLSIRGELTVGGRVFDGRGICRHGLWCGRGPVDGCECGYQVRLLLKAGDGAADTEEVIGVGDCLCQGIHDVATLDS